ncbi:MAG: V-type ATP synthase subunit D [Oscillospiraceae bacterium]
MNGNISPTKGNLMATKKSLALARVGYDLMDRKRNILVREMMALIDKANSLRGRIDDTYGTAYQALESANISMGQEITEAIARSIPEEKGLSMDFRSVMGVELPSVALEDSDLRLEYDMSSSNAAFDEAFVRFHEVKLMLAELAELENSVYRLAVAIKKTQSRANALKNIIIPGFTGTVKFITDALDEKDREEFSRLKVIKRSKEN